jgi:hypothetical protein
LGARSHIGAKAFACLAFFAGTMAHGQQAAPVYGSQTSGPGPAPAPEPGPGRVIQVDLLLTDPTVAAPQHWLIGGAVEAWYAGIFNVQYEDKSLSSDTINSTTALFRNLGGNVTFGYDDFWALISYRTGTERQARTYSGFDVGVDGKASEGEIKLRYLMRDTHWGQATPYLIGGYNYFKIDSDFALPPGVTWAGTQSGSFLRTNEFHSIFAGAGVMMPLARVFGIRADLAFAPVYGIQTDASVPGAKLTAWGMGMTLHATGYYLITESLVVQSGVKLSAYNLSNLAGADFRPIGGYINLGYVQRF